MPSLCIYAELPAKFHDLFPSERGGDDESPPHVTILYVGKVKESEVNEICDICVKICRQFRAIRCKFGKLNSFPAGKDGTPYYVEIDAAPELEALHHILWGVLLKGGYKIEHNFKYHPHATLKYMDGKKPYSGKIPEGEFEISSCIVSVFEDK